MLGEGGTPLSDLEDAARCFLQRGVGSLGLKRLRRGERSVDLERFRAVIDALEGDFAVEARRMQQSGAHLAHGAASAVGWISRTCGMSATSAADRVCVGEQLESLPKIGEALSSGEIRSSSGF